jgi:hypothetical protein
LDDADHAWIADWTEMALPSQFAVPADGPLALILFLAVVEIARGNAAETNLWSIVHDELPQSVARGLFAPNNQPNEDMKALITTAVRWAGLRNVVDSTDEHRWRNTVLLQLGFTMKGASESLGRWLVGLGRPVAVQQLLDEHAGSAAFRDLWRALSRLRRRRAEDPSHLHGQDWALPGAPEDLARAARSEADLGMADDLGMEVSGEPALVFGWATEPTFRFRLDHPPSLHGVERTLHLVERDDAKRDLARLVQASDGSYRWTKAATSAITPKPLVVLELRSGEGVVRVAWEHTLWDEAAPSLYRGPRDRMIGPLDPWTEDVRDQEEVVLMLPWAPDPRLETLERHPLSGGAFAFRLGPGLTVRSISGEFC